jgi:putative transposase
MPGRWGVSCQTFYDWQTRLAAGPTQRERDDADLLEQVREIHVETHGNYGVPRMTVELANRGQPTNHKGVERLMTKERNAGVVNKPAKVRTTIPAEGNPPMGDLAGRGFRPNPTPNLSPEHVEVPCAHRAPIIAP